MREDLPHLLALLWRCESVTSFRLNCPPYGQNAAKAPQPLVCAMPAWIRPASRQSAHAPRALVTAPLATQEHRSRRVVKRWRCHSLRPTRHRMPEHKVYLTALELTAGPVYIQLRQQPSPLTPLRTLPDTRVYSTDLGAEH